MEIVDISEENLEEFAPLLGEDLSEDVKRLYFNGIGALNEDGEAVGAFVYELLNSESEEDTTSRICLLNSPGGEVTSGLENHYAETSVPEGEVVESFYEMEKESDAKALKDLGFTLENKEDETLTVTLESLSATDLGKKRKLPDFVESIENLSILEYRSAIKEILFKGHTGIFEDMPFLSKNWFDNRISSCVVSGGKVPGLFLVRCTPSGVLIPSLLFAYGPEYKKHLLLMIAYSLQQAAKLYPPDTKVRIARKDAAAKALAEKLLPNQSGARIFFGTRKE